MKVIVLESNFRKGVSKKNSKPFAIFFTWCAYEANEGKFRFDEFSLSADKLNGLTPERGMILDIDLQYKTGFVNNVSLVTNDENGLLQSFVAPFQKMLTQNSGK